MKQLTEEQAITHLEQLRWPTGAACPFCKLHQVTKLDGKRPGFYQCNRCRKQFTVRTGTVMERSHISLSKWLQAVHLLCASKKGMSALQISRMLGVTHKSAWFLCHRIREAMRTSGGLLQGTVEVDETYVGGKAINQHSKRGRGAARKTPVMALIQRDGQAKTRIIHKAVCGKNLKEVVRELVDEEATVVTDEFSAYRHLDEFFASHKTVNHSKKEYVRGGAHVNTCESYFALLKRGVMGSFHHLSRKHLHRYCDEFSFRWDTRQQSDAERADAALKLAEGKRLLYCSLTNGEAKAQAN